MKEKIKQSLAARQHMIDNQIYTNKVENEFMPLPLQGVAYIDGDLPLGENRILMEPMVFARLLEFADIKKHEKILVIGCGTGYPVAVISGLAEQVIGLENNINFIFNHPLIFHLFLEK